MSGSPEHATDHPAGATSTELADLWRSIVTGRSDSIGADPVAAAMTDDMRRHMERQFVVARQAVVAGLFDGEKSARLAVRVTRELLDAAKARSGIASQTHLIEYALSKVALEDDFGPKLVARKGRVPDGTDF